MDVDHVHVRQVGAPVDDEEGNGLDGLIGEDCDHKGGAFEHEDLVDGAFEHEDLADGALDREDLMDGAFEYVGHVDCEMQVGVDPYGHTCLPYNHLVINIVHQLEHSLFFSHQLQAVHSFMVSKVELQVVDPYLVYVGGSSNQVEHASLDALLQLDVDQLYASLDSSHLEA